MPRRASSFRQDASTSGPRCRAGTTCARRSEAFSRSAGRAQRSASYGAASRVSARAHCSIRRGVGVGHAGAPSSRGSSRSRTSRTPPLQQVVRADPGPARSPPAPQQDALRITFGLPPARRPTGFLVGLATVSLVSEAADERPLLCLIDDAHWLDHASAQMLAFVARRLLAEPIVLLFATRTPSDEIARSAGAGARWVAGGRRARAAGVRDHGEAGRPGCRPARRGGAREPAGTAGAGRVAFARAAGRRFRLTRGVLGAGQGRGELRSALRDARCDPRARCCCSPRPSRPAIRRSCGVRRSVSGSPTTRWRRAEAAGLVELGPPARFRHPLARSAVYRAAEPQARRQAHRALAEVTDTEADPDRRAWHLAAATAGLDEDVAAELERAAGPRAGARRPGRCRGVPRARGRALARSGDPGADGRWRRRRPSSAPARSTTPCGCSPAPTRARSATSSVVGPICCARGSRSRPAAAATRRRCCSTPRDGWRESTCCSRGTPTWRRWPPPCSPGAWPRRAPACSTWHGPRRARRGPSARHALLTCCSMA